MVSCMYSFLINILREEYTMSSMLQFETPYHPRGSNLRAHVRAQRNTWKHGLYLLKAAETRFHATFTHISAAFKDIISSSSIYTTHANNIYHVIKVCSCTPMYNNSPWTEYLVGTNINFDIISSAKTENLIGHTSYFDQILTTMPTKINSRHMNMDWNR